MLDPDQLEWEDPEPDHRKRKPGHAARIFEALRARPGEWAIVAEYDHQGSASSTAWNFRNRGCEALTRSGTVYARWPVTS